jgi:transcriptional regulator with XRE-family HTH domain
MQPEEAFKSNLLALRKERGLSQKQVADEAGISEVGYRFLEKGHSKPSFDMLIALADFFDVSLDYLVGRKDEP